MALDPGQTENHLKEKNARELDLIQRALQENEDWYRDLVEHSQDLLCIHDLQGQLLSVNPAPARVLGYTVDELLQIPMREIIVPEFRVQFDAYLSQIASAGEARGLLAVLTRSGEQRIWDYHNTLRTKGVASPIVRGMAHDITERIRADKLLREANQRLSDNAQERERTIQELKLFRALVDQSNDAIQVVDPETLRILDVNEKACRDLGYCREDLLSLTVFDIDPTVNQSSLARIRKELHETGFVIGERIHRRKDGSTFPVEINIKHVQFDRAYHVVITRDITERKLVDQALRDTKEFSENLIQTANVIILGLDTEGKINLFNHAAETITGYTFSEVKGRNWFETLVPKDRYPYVWEEFGRLMAGIAAETFENPILTRTGEERYIAWRNSQVRLNGKVVATISFGNDITEHKRAEQALRRSEENYRAFIAQSSEGIFRQDLDAPIPVDLPEDELVHHILYDSYLAECNDAIVKMYGLNSVQDFLGKRLTETVDPNDPRNIELTRDYIRSGFRVVERESREVDIHGNPKVFLNSMIGLVENGKLVRTWGIQRDVTERVRLEDARCKAEEALRQSEQRFRVALAGSPVRVFNQDRDLRYTWVYNLQEGWTEQEYLGKTDEEIFALEDAARMTSLKRQVLESGKGVREEITITTRGNTSYCDLTIEPLLDAAGAVIGVNCACWDVTYLREIMEELRFAKEKLAEEKLYLEHSIDTELGFGDIIGQSKALKAVMAQVAKVAASDTTVLLLGETGTGKELVARAIHRMGKRKDNTFIKMNCAAIPSTLLESELLGHEKGAYTGAFDKKVGRLELADRGTLFLDEIGEMPVELQPKLLRVLQDHEFERLGGTRTLKVDFRLIAATNRDLLQGMKDREFRSDLYYRLNVFPILLPPLRERRDDIRLLVEHFVRKYAARANKSITSIPKKTMDTLMQWDWPGNIRELENFVERSVILTHGTVLQVPLAELVAAAQVSSKNSQRDAEREQILQALRDCHGQLSGPRGAAARLGLKTAALELKLKQLGIRREEYRT